MNKLVMSCIAAAAVALPLTGCAASNEFAGTQDCIILAVGGNKLCGDDAKAWCDSTDGVRDSAQEMASDPTYGDASTSDSVRQAQADCDTIRGQ